MQQEQQNAFNRQCISEALIRLMETKAYDDITVTEICRMAGVSRMTYYRNYSSKREIFSDYMKMIVDEFVRVQRAKDLKVRSYEMILAGFLYFCNSCVDITYIIIRVRYLTSILCGCVMVRKKMLRISRKLFTNM